MKYCVIKNTLKVIDGSENPLTTMFENSLSAGFQASEVEILTEEEYQTRKALEPILPQEPSEMEVLKEENELLKSKLQTTEHMARETSQSQQELLELLIEMGVI